MTELGLNIKNPDWILIVKYDCPLISASNS